MRSCLLTIVLVLLLQVTSIWSLNDDEYRSGRIVGGAPAPKSRYPYIAACVDGAYLTCAGVLIHPQLLLSAAHCFQNCNRVKLNVLHHSDTKDMNPSMEEYDIVEKRMHDLYNVGTDNKCDLAVFKLSGISRQVPVALNAVARVPQQGERVTVVGWGATEELGEPIDMLRHVDVFYRTNARCMDSYGADAISPDMMCAAVPTGGRDACQGDSGGPLLRRALNGDGGDPANDVCVGIVSWGYGCAHPDYPGVYSRVQHELQWIYAAAEALHTTAAKEYIQFRAMGGTHEAYVTLQTRMKTQNNTLVKTKTQPTSTRAKQNQALKQVEEATFFMDCIQKLRQSKLAASRSQHSKGDGCEDMKFMGRRKKPRYCSWVLEEKEKRCQRFRYCCPTSCHSCDDVAV